MATLFLDASAVAKRYIAAEVHARRVQEACAPAADTLLIVARHTSVELASALARRVREGGLQSEHRERLWRSFSQHWAAQYQVVPAAERVFALAEALVAKHPLRAADALQIASVLVVAAAEPDAGLQLWTADQRQAAGARAEGLDVELLV